MSRWSCWLVSAGSTASSRAEDRAQPLELAERELAPIAERIQPHETAVGGFVGRLEVEELAQDVGRGVDPARALMDLRDPRHQRQVILGKALADDDRPVRIAIVGQRLATVQLARGEETVEVVDAISSPRRTADANAAASTQMSPAGNRVSVPSRSTRL